MMLRSCSVAAVVIALGLIGTADAAPISCQAEAGLTKAAAAAVSKSAERTGSYDVDVSAGSSGRASVIVSVHPHSPAAAAAAARPTARIDRVLLRSPYKSEAIAQPVSFAHGATASDAVATFDASAVQALPTGDINVILFTPDGERMCRIAGKDRSALGNR